MKKHKPPKLTFDEHEIIWVESIKRCCETLYGTGGLIDDGTAALIRQSIVDSHIKAKRKSQSWFAMLFRPGFWKMRKELEREHGKPFDELYAEEPPPQQIKGGKHEENTERVPQKQKN